MSLKSEYMYREVPVSLPLISLNDKLSHKSLSQGIEQTRYVGGATRDERESHNLASPRFAVRDKKYGFALSFSRCYCEIFAYLAHQHPLGF